MIIVIFKFSGTNYWYLGVLYAAPIHNNQYLLKCSIHGFKFLYESYSIVQA